MFCCGTSNGLARGSSWQEVQSQWHHAPAYLKVLLRWLTCVYMFRRQRKYELVFNGILGTNYMFSNWQPHIIGGRFGMYAINQTAVTLVSSGMMQPQFTQNSPHDQESFKALQKVIHQYDISPQLPLLGLLSWCPTFRLNHFNSFHLRVLSWRKRRCEVVSTYTILLRCLSAGCLIFKWVKLQILYRIPGE